SCWLRDLEEFFGTEYLAKRIRAHHCEALKQALLARPVKDGELLSTRSTKDRIQFYRSIWDWGIRMEYLDGNPFRKLTEIKVTRRYKADPFTQEESARLLAAAKLRMPWFYPVVLTAAI